MTGPGLKEEDPLMILDDEDDDDINRSGALDFFGVHPLSTLGSRMPRTVVLQAKDVLVGGITITGDRVCDNLLNGLKCPICLGLKSNPVVATCAYSFCYLQLPSVHETHVQPPDHVIALKDLMAALYPNMPDNTAVEWGRAWDALNFPVDI
ncbi:hypothetical protein B0H10DRAFT_1961079 [Mycena sp. CBHHK59/15]|nr:hypothetical protein B0H10DRAFT_1961079 [Mycena sp. CBHHK59/15]